MTCKARTLILGRFPFTLFLIFASFVLGKAQDVIPSQFQPNMQWINPALIGEHGGVFRIAINSRQIRFLNTPYITSYFSIEYKVFSNKFLSHFCLAAMAYSDKEGDNNQVVSTNIQCSIAYKQYLGKIKKNDFYLYAGGQYGRLQRRFSSNGGFLQGRYYGINAGINFVLVRPTFWLKIGSSLGNINEPNTSVYQNANIRIPLDRKFNIHLAMNINLLDGDMELSPLLLYQKQGLYTILLTGLDFRFNNFKQDYGQNAFDISLGLHYRATGTIVINTKLKFKKNYSLGISYDIPAFSGKTPINKLLTAEFFLAYTFPRNRNSSDNQESNKKQPINKNKSFEENRLGW